MKVLVFDVWGKFAHFRKYHANSSSLSYKVPPRTVVTGLIAAVLGYERDSYYELLSPDNSNISVQILERPRVIMQTVNYYKIESAKHFRTPKDHTQIPIELITGERQVRYRIYFSHNEGAVLEELNRRLEEHKYVYAPYLGAAPFQCYLDKVYYGDMDMVTPDEVVPVYSVVGVEEVESNSLQLGVTQIRIEREIMPRSFDAERYLSEARTYLYEAEGKPLYMKVKSPVLKAEEEKYLVFM